MFKTRLISGIFLVIAALLTIISGGYVLFVTLLCVSLLGIQELYKAMEVHKDGIGLLEMAGYLGAVLYYASLLLDFESYMWRSCCLLSFLPETWREENLLYG